MTLELIHCFHQADPFAPFDLFLADGRVVSVEKSEFLMMVGDGRSVSVFRQPNVTELIDADLIVSLQVSNHDVEPASVGFHTRPETK
ncbi:MAG TPA: hypothetical protein VF614_00715 [Chthoniobacteraceae bacterium]|jgi:hypothetical protein